MEQALEIPGVQNAFTMPIKARIDMLTTGIRTPVGIKILGDDLVHINSIGEEIEAIIRTVPGTRSVYATREMGGFFIDFIPDRETIARYGLNVLDVFDIIETSIGGMDVDTTIEGRERYKINVRYPRELRDDIDQLKNILVPIPMQKRNVMHEPMMNPSSSGRMEHVPLGLLGKVQATMGPPEIKNEFGSLTGWVYIDTDDPDIGGYVTRAKQAIHEKLKLPERYYLKWTGQYEYLERMQALMKVTIPLTLLLIFIILLFNFGGIIQTLIIMLSVPLGAMGAIWLMYAWSYNTSVAVWVGLIALLGIAAQTASLMMVYLEEGYHLWIKSGKLKTKKDVITMAIEHGASRIRPLIMAVGLNIFGLIPIMLHTGAGSDVAQRISAPLWGGLISVIIVTFFIIPGMYVIWRSAGLPEKVSEAGAQHHA